jgi:hypothetical protein
LGQTYPNIRKSSFRLNTTFEPLGHRRRLIVGAVLDPGPEKGDVAHYDQTVAHFLSLALRFARVQLAEKRYVPLLPPLRVRGLCPDLQSSLPNPF